MNQATTGQPNVRDQWMSRTAAPANTKYHLMPRYSQRRGAGQRRDAASTFSITKAGYS